MITGAGGGIGRALAAGFLEDGANVVALNRSRTKRPLRHRRLLTLLGDVTSEADVQSAVEAAVTRFGRIDVLVNNAGVNHPGEFVSQPLSDWVEQVQVNLVGAGICTHFVLCQMKSQGYGRVVNLVSRDAENARPFCSGYAASKAGLVTLTKSLSREIDGDGDILVNAVIPGLTKTGMCPNGQEPEAVYPFVREAATLPAGGPNGRIFFRGRDYPFFAAFSGHSDAGVPATLGRYRGASSGFGLSPAELEGFRERGYLGPFAAYQPDEMAEIRDLLEQRIPKFREGHRSAATALQQVRNRHLDLPLVARICRHPALVERLAALLGPDLLLWRSNFFIQSGMPDDGLPWHQDRYLTLLAEPRTNLSAQFAITESSRENCMVFLPGTHRLSRAELGAKYGLEFEEWSEGGAYGTPRFHPVDPGRLPLDPIVMKPGEFVIFDEALLHASSVAERASRRIGLAVRVTVPQVRVLPEAFVESLPLVHRCALLRGNNAGGLNELSSWPEE
jgi:NAD(P)-dependent dehydrogenase (short-subunit alcohol dehydrogenase family)